MNPYANLNDSNFWRRAVSVSPSGLVDPVLESNFKIKEDTKVVTAGSCFAQHLAKRLSSSGFQYLITEQGLNFSDGHRVKNQYGVYSARFGNIYTTRQLRQLLNEVFLNEPRKDIVSTRKDGRYVDILRPQVEVEGYDSPEAVLVDRESHLRAVSEMFLQSDVFIFTLGLTEAWQRTSDGLVVPIAPGVVTTEDVSSYEYINLRYNDVYEDLLGAIKIIKEANPNIQIILTVSPVPLVATYENQHVVVSTAYSKATLRAVAGDIASDSEYV
ncbi:GSCFA domain-containing protein, partial [Rheinheimera baltica]|uniref:GSCFA domain-containing protein n=1 Tax=Rheinheimera baltica TaxID=67576 RepID=UPI00273F14D5